MQPPTWIPGEWLLFLGVVLPFIYQTFLSKWTGFWKTVFTVAISAAIAVALGIFYLHIHTLLEFVRNSLLIWAAATFFYKILSPFVTFLKKGKNDNVCKEPKVEDETK